MAKEHEQYLRELRRQGYVTIRKMRSNHLRVFCPQGHLVATHSANGGSEYRGLMNFKAEVRRHEQWHSDQDQDHDNDHDEQHQPADADTHQPAR